MEIFWLSIVVLGIVIFLMCFNIIFRKQPFPDTEIGHSKELRKKGIICAKEEEQKIWGKKRKGSVSCSEEGCVSCSASGCSAKEDKNNK